MSTPAPDFEALRAERNAKHAELVQRLAGEGWNASGCMHNDPNACYCACPDGPCEHKWDGAPYQDDQMWSTTCSRCGILSYSHSLRVMP